MRLSLLAAAGAAAALMTAGPLPAAAEDYKKPEALLQALYKPYLANDPDAVPEPDAFFSERLKALYDKDHEGGVGNLDFDPVVAGQDYQLSAFEIGRITVDGDTADAAVSFTNMETPVTLDYSLILEDGGWKIDDIASTAGDNPFVMTGILAN